jgi:hypothetical protein
MRLFKENRQTFKNHHQKFLISLCGNTATIKGKEREKCEAMKKK